MCYLFCLMGNHRRLQQGIKLMPYFLCNSYTHICLALPLPPTLGPVATIPGLPYDENVDEQELAPEQDDATDAADVWCKAVQDQAGPQILQILL